MEVTHKDIGKKVTFKLNICNWIPKKETRIIRDVTISGYIIIHYEGSKNFFIKQDEVIEVD